MIPIAKPSIGEEEKNAVMKVLDSGVLASGNNVLEFERLFAEYIGSKYAIAVSSGTAALQIALMAHGIGKNRLGIDEVITTPFTFIATANSIIWSGAKPVFVDIEEDTFNISPDSILDKIKKRDSIVAILPVHLYGLGADMKSIAEIAKDYDLIVIEDACQAVGLKKWIGYGTTCYSFYPTKNMTTGEGGMITVDDNDIYDKCKLIRSHGTKVESKYVHEILGYNFRMTDVAAAIGKEQLKKLDMFNNIRYENTIYLNKGLEGIDNIITPVIGNNHVFNQYTIRISNGNRDKLKKMLNEKGIGAEIYYPMPIYKQPLYKELGYNDKLDNVERVCKQVLSLPIYPGITKDNMDAMILTIREEMER